MLFFEYVELMAQDEKILACVIGEPTMISDAVIPQQQDLGQLLKWDDAKLQLAYEFDDGTSVDGCFVGVPQTIMAWTAHHVIFAIAGEAYYPDLVRVPRNPVAGLPEMVDV